jgi:hypothetical protein
MLQRMLRATLLFAFSLAVGGAVPCFAISKDFHQTYPLQVGGTFDLQNVNGTVEVQGWDRNEIDIRAVKMAKNKESDLALVSIDVEANANAVSVATHYPQNEGVEVVVEYTVHVPHLAHLEHLGTINGTLRIAGVEDVEDVHSVNGNVEVYGGGGSVHAHTTNGNVRLELLHVPDTAGTMAETTNGSVILAIPADTQATLETRCLNGNFSSELPVAMQSTLRPREMHGKLGKGGAAIRLNTINGTIRVLVLRSTV